jgi:tetratricopeptide (TPR) repeat protein
LPLLLGGGFVIVAAAAFAFYWTSTAKVRQFREAVEKGRLVAPAGDNALELYQQVVREKGNSSSAATKLREIARPVLQSRSDELFRQWYSEADLGDTRWADVQKLQDWLAEIKPHDPVVRARQEYAAGQVTIIGGRYGEALNHYRRALAFQTDWPLALNGIGRACRNLRDMSCAEDFYRRAANADPRWIFPRQNLGGVYLELSRLQEAEAEYLAAINMDPNRAGSRFLLAQLYERARRKDDACQQYNSALRLAENLQRPPFDREVARQRAARVCR